MISLKEKIGSIKAVMFDLDGTLIDSVPPYFRLMESILGAAGLPPAPKPLVAEFMTQGIPAFEKMIPPDMHHRKDELIEKCLTLGRKMLRDMLKKEVELIPGVEELFSAVTNKRIPIGVVTSTFKIYLDLKLGPLERKGLKGLLSSVIATEDAPKKKPAPDPLFACAREIGVSPQHCIYIGDSHVDIQAGQKAGMMTAGVLTGLHDRETLARENPTLIVDSVAQLIPLFA